MKNSLFLGLKLCTAYFGEKDIHLKEMENNEDGLEALAHLLGTSPSPSLTTSHTYCLTVFAFSFVFSIS